MILTIVFIHDIEIVSLLESKRPSSHNFDSNFALSSMGLL